MNFVWETCDGAKCGGIPIRFHSVVVWWGDARLHRFTHDFSYIPISAVIVNIFKGTARSDPLTGASGAWRDRARVRELHYASIVNQWFKSWIGDSFQLSPLLRPCKPSKAPSWINSPFRVKDRCKKLEWSVESSCKLHSSRSQISGDDLDSQLIQVQVLKMAVEELKEAEPPALDSPATWPEIATCSWFLWLVLPFVALLEAPILTPPAAKARCFENPPGFLRFQ